MDLVSYQKQGMVGVDLALDGKYSSGPRFVQKAGGGGGGSRFGWKVQLWTSFRTENRGWWGWILLWVESTVIDVRYRDVRYRDVRYRDVRYRDVRYRDVGYRDVG